MAASNRLKLQEYTLENERVFAQLFAQKKVTDPDFSRTLTQSIVHCFHIPTEKIHKEKKAFLILDPLFYQFSILTNTPFHLPKFIESCSLKKGELKSFLIAVINGLYFGDINLSDLQKHNRRENLELFMFQIVAEHVSNKTLTQMLSRLSLDQQAALICYCFKNYREGSFFILSLLENMPKKQTSSPLLKKLIVELRRKYFDTEIFLRLLQERSEIDEKNLQEIISELEKQALELTKDCYSLFSKVIPLMIESPVLVFEELEKLKQQIQTYKPANNDKEAAENKRNNLKMQFEKYGASQYTFNEFQAFVRSFGLYGKFPLFEQQGEKIINFLSLIKNLQLIEEIFRNPLTLAATDPYKVRNFFGFVLTIILHLDSLHHDPSKYQGGLARLTCGIPTCGRTLSAQPAIVSIVTGFDTLVKFLNHKKAMASSIRENDDGGPAIALRDYPIFVFDQSDSQLFEINSRYIRALNRRYNSSIIQISKEEALSLAKKIGIENLIVTTRKGEFGYAGARNCIFLMAPVLKNAFDMGFRSLKDVLEMDHEELMPLFQQFVLGDDSNPLLTGSTIFMVDDDIDVPESNIFSHALFAEESWNHYSHLYGYTYGRDTKSSIKFLSLQNLLQNPSEIFKFTKWKRFPFLAGMSELITKPKICLNLPFGNEEKHLILSRESNLLLQPSIHLAGPRYPGNLIPTHFFVALETYLEKFIPYAVCIGMMYDLLDPPGREDKKVLLWNEIDKIGTFKCLKDVFAFATNESTIKEMQRRFWENVEEVFHSKCTGSLCIKVSLA